MPPLLWSIRFRKPVMHQAQGRSAGLRVRRGFKLTNPCPAATVAGFSIPTRALAPRPLPPQAPGPHAAERWRALHEPEGSIRCQPPLVRKRSGNRLLDLARIAQGSHQTVIRLGVRRICSDCFPERFPTACTGIRSELSLRFAKWSRRFDYFVGIGQCL